MLKQNKVYFFSNSKGEAIINESDIDDIFESTYTVNISKIQTFLREGSGWVIHSVIDHIVNI